MENVASKRHEVVIMTMFELCGQSYKKTAIVSYDYRAVVVAQLVERSLPIPEVHGSNSVIGKNLFILNICLLSTVYWKDENKEKEAGDGPFFKKVTTIELYWLKNC